MMRPQGFWKTDDMYRAVTRQIEVTVEPNFLPERSVEGGQYFWSYTIVITNTGEETVQLRTRHWIITDASGHSQEVRGEGVVGEQPVLAPGLPCALLDLRVERRSKARVVQAARLRRRVWMT